ncbi:MAG: sterol desaturase family protein [Bacteroidota bacterium]|nr:sterol desaturase family protein [Bacteroidota bacterium]
MDTYANTLLIAIPIFFISVLLEALYGNWIKDQKHNFMDTISSLSSGITNLSWDVLGIAFFLFTYEKVYQYIMIFNIELDSLTTSNQVSLYIVAFICIDFASYCHHYLKHSVNLFWNQHIIHHSSEEFNLACALRQSVTNNFGVNALFLIPAALCGVPPEVVQIILPLHLFAQFWYHTRHIGKLGFLEYIIVTPSQHRVHHAINPEYIDKNLGAIFCFWDRAFGTFQEELDEVPCIFGTLKPVRTWNPVLINFIHLWGLTQDAWNTRKWNDKLKLWFMPTGWRPSDVSLKFPKKIVTDVYNQKKYSPQYTFKHKLMTVFQFMCINIMSFLFLYNFSDIDLFSRIAYVFLIFITIFGFTSLMDGHNWALVFEISRSIIGLIIIIYFSQNLMLEKDLYFTLGFGFYFLVTFLITILIGPSLPKRVLLD